ncbi:hypothetical protein [Streptomyces microflavus]|uniref:hypothetical protein n=1 Tax=Streptomyces microflavus TaxID=1919 RepID=UPI0036A62826
MAVSEALITALGGGTMTGFLAYLGIRYTARQSGEVQRAAIEVEQRKVDREQFESFKQAYREERQQDQEELERLSEKLNAQAVLIRSAVRHIRVLRSELARNQIPPPPLPVELEVVDLF